MFFFGNTGRHCARTSCFVRCPGVGPSSVRLAARCRTAAAKTERSQLAGACISETPKTSVCLPVSLFLASKGFPSGYLKCVCASACTQKTPNLSMILISQTTPEETPRRHHLADGHLSSLYRPSPSFSSFGAAFVMCCAAPASCSSTPSRS